MSSTSNVNNAVQYPYYIQLSGKREVAVDPGVDIVLNNPFEIFDWKWKESSDNISWVEANGEWVSKNDYPTAYDTLLEEWSNGTSGSETINNTIVNYRLSSHKRKILSVDDISVYESLYNNIGIAWYYVIDITNKRFKLPRTKYGFVGDRGDVGSYVPESLPQHTHIEQAFYDDVTSSGGAIRYISNGKTDGTSVGARSIASGSIRTGSEGVSTTSADNASYQNNAPVQQRATQVKLYFYVGETITNPNYINAESIMKDVIQIARDKETEIETFAENQYDKIVEEANKQLAKVSMQGLLPFDIVQKDHVLSFDESNGNAELGTYVYKTSVAGTRYGYPDFYNLCLSEYNVATEEDLTVGSQTIKIKKNTNGHIYYDIADKSIVDSLYVDKGSAWMYGIDTENERVFLPRKQHGKLVESYHDNSSWYRLYEDGWVEQGGYVEGTTDTFTVDLLVPMLDTDYTLLTTINDDYSNNSNTVTWGGVFGYKTSTTQITLAGRGGGRKKSWEVKGYSSSAPLQTNYYMVVGTVDEVHAVTDITEITTTDNDTLPLFADLTFSVKPDILCWLPANYTAQGNEYLTAYTTLVNSLTDNTLNVKVVESHLMESDTNYDNYWIVDTTAVTFRTPIISSTSTDTDNLYFKVGNVVQNLQIIDVSTLQQNKLDKDLTNITNTGKSLISGLGMPSGKVVDLTLGASGTTYTAPANGYVVLKKNSTAANQVVELYTGVNSRSVASANGQTLCVCAPVQKGFNFILNYSLAGETAVFKFVYAEGEN
jgi:hypothetical protein